MDLDLDVTVFSDEEAEEKERALLEEEEVENLKESIEFLPNDFVDMIINDMNIKTREDFYIRREDVKNKLLERYPELARHFLETVDEVFHEFVNVVDVDPQ